MSVDQAALPSGSVVSRAWKTLPDTARVAIGIFAFITIWTTFHAISHGMRAINDDTAEAYVWGQQFEWGFWKHPPFWAWIAGAWFDVFPRNVASIALLASVNAAIGLVGAWKLTGCFLRDESRASATVLLLLTPLYTFLAFTFNANSIFIPLWPWTAYFFVRAIDRQSFGASILFGAMAAIDMMSKYYAAILIVTCIAAAMIHSARKACMRSMLPWLSAATAALLFAPHLYWLAHSNYATLHYFGRETGHGAVFVVRQLAVLIGECIAYNAVAAVFVMAVTRTSPADWLSRFRERVRDSRFRFLAVLALLPAGLTLICSVLFRVSISSNTMIGVFCLTPVLFLDLAAPADPAKLQRASFVAVGLVTVASLLAAPALASLGTRDLAFTRSIAQQLDLLWTANAHTPLRYVAGAEPYSEKMAFYLPERPQDFILYNFAAAPWVTPGDLARNGFAAVCPSQDARCIANARKFAPARLVEKTILLPGRKHNAANTSETFTLIAALPKETSR